MYINCVSHLFYIDERVNVSYLSTDLKPNKEEFKYALKNKRFIKIIKEGYKAFRIILKKRSLIRQCAKVNDADIIISSTLAFDKAFSKHQKNKLLIAWEHCHPDRDPKYPKKYIVLLKSLTYLFQPQNQSMNFIKNT